jgi:hypothetical protein
VHRVVCSKQKCACTYTYTHAHTNTRKNTYKHTHTSTWIHTQYTHMHVHTHTHLLGGHQVGIPLWLILQAYEDCIIGNALFFQGQPYLHTDSKHLKVSYKF